MRDTIRGSVYKCGDNVTAYDIIARNRWPLGLNAEELGKWAMEGACPEVLNVENGFKSKGLNIVVAGVDFGGGGKSIEHPIAALQGAGVEVMIAESFSRYSFRNAINRGFPAVLCPGITGICSTGDEMEVELKTGMIRNLTTGQEIKGAPLPDFVLEFVENGGMIKCYGNKLAGERTF